MSHSIRLTALLVLLTISAAPVSAVPISIDFEFSSITVSFDGVTQATGAMSMSILTDTDNPNLGTGFGNFNNSYDADVFFTAAALGLNNTRVTSPTSLYFGNSVVGFSGGVSNFGTIITAYIGPNLSFGSQWDLSTLVVPQGPVFKTGTEFRTGNAITFENGSQFDSGAFTTFSGQNSVTVSLRNEVPEPATLALLGLGLAGLGYRRRNG